MLAMGVYVLLGLVIFMYFRLYFFHTLFFDIET